MKNGDRLGYCLAIDINHSTVRDEYLKALVDKSEDDGLDLVAAIKELRVNAATAPLNAVKNTENDPLEDDYYIRALVLSEFGYYYGHENGVVGDDWDEDDLRQMFFKRTSEENWNTAPVNPDEWDSKENHGNMGTVVGPFSGGDGIVWVTCLSAIKAALAAGDTGDEAAEKIFDSLGLATEDGPRSQPCEIVLVRYPTDFNMPAPRQASSFIGGWDGGWYLSDAGTSNWGHTKSTSSGGVGLAERVHGPVLALNDQFISIPVGITSTPKLDSNDWLNEAKRRL